MLTVNVPNSLHAYSQISGQEISFVHYRESSPIGRNLISFGQCAISFILSGEKELFRKLRSTPVKAGQGVVIPQGNAVIAERKLQATEYSSLVIFFPFSIASEYVRMSGAGLFPLTTTPTKTTSTKDFLCFEVTPYLNLYIKNILTLINQQAGLTDSVMLHRLQELFLILAEMHGETFLGLWNTHQSQTVLQLRTLIENNISKGFTLEEFAFLANRSLASFKRDFEKAYDMSPGKYLLKRKMEIACHALQSGKTPAETAMEIGYENLSHFTAIFRKWTGHTPREYQNLPVLIEPLAT